jgi:ComEC/Rec2-related protein
MRAQPFLGMALALALGVHIYQATHWLVIICTGIVLSIIAVITRYSPLTRLLPFFILGSIIICQKEAEMSSRYRIYENNMSEQQRYAVEQIREGKRSTRLTCREVQSEARIYAYLDKRLLQPLPGDTLMFSDQPKPIPSPVEPLSFDFQNYAHYQGVHHVIRINRADQYDIISKRGSSIARIIYGRRSRIEHILKTYLSDPIVEGLALGILLGDKSEIPQSVEGMMSSTGTLHVMAVSGLHVGIICALLMWALGRSGWWPLRIVKLVACLAGVWMFVLITGGRPSAVRAATMFSLYIIGWTSHLKSPPLNILASAAFFILCSNPYLLYQVSFQLSVSAVASILLFFPLIENLWKPQKPFLKALWSLSAMSLSVQILVAPVSMFYFHSFPLTFLPANIIAIPMATLLMLSCLALVGVHCISSEVAAGIGSFIQGCANLGLSLLNSLTRINGHTLSDLWPGKEPVLLFIIGASLIPLTLNASLWFRLLSSALIVVSVIFSHYHFLCRHHEPKIICYPISQPYRIDINSGNNYYVLSRKNPIRPSPYQSWCGHSKGYDHLKVAEGDTLIVFDESMGVGSKTTWILEAKGWARRDTINVHSATQNLPSKYEEAL